MREAETIYWPTKKNNNMHSKDENHIFLFHHAPVFTPYLPSIACKKIPHCYFLFLLFFSNTFWQSHMAIWLPGKFALPSRARAQARRPLNRGAHYRAEWKEKRRSPPRSVSPSGRPPLAPQRMTRDVTQAGRRRGEAFLKKKKKKKNPTALIQY